MRPFGDLHLKSLVLSFGFFLSDFGLLYFFGTGKGHNGPRAISKIMKWVPIVLCSSSPSGSAPAPFWPPRKEIESQYTVGGGGIPPPPPPTPPPKTKACLVFVFFLQLCCTMKNKTPQHQHTCSSAPRHRHRRPPGDASLPRIPLPPGFELATPEQQAAAQPLHSEAKT